jgi:hypothetical protein
MGLQIKGIMELNISSSNCYMLTGKTVVVIHPCFGINQFIEKKLDSHKWKDFQVYESQLYLP